MPEVLLNMLPDNIRDGSRSHGDIAEALGRIEHDGPRLTVVSNRFHFNGFSAVFYPGVLDELAGAEGGNLVVIPSSVHEALVFADDGNMEAEHINGMIMEVNHTQVLEEERLSDRAYYYDRDRRELFFMDDYRKGDRSVCVKF